MNENHKLESFVNKSIEGIKISKSTYSLFLQLGDKNFRNQIFDIMCLFLKGNPPPLNQLTKLKYNKSAYEIFINKLITWITNIKTFEEHHEFGLITGEIKNNQKNKYIRGTQNTHIIIFEYSKVNVQTDIISHNKTLISSLFTNLKFFITGQKQKYESAEQMVLNIKNLIWILNHTALDANYYEPYIVTQLLMILDWSIFDVFKLTDIMIIKNTTLINNMSDFDDIKKYTNKIPNDITTKYSFRFRLKEELQKKLYSEFYENGILIKYDNNMNISSKNKIRLHKDIVYPIWSCFKITENDVDGNCKKIIEDTITTHGTPIMITRKNTYVYDDDLNIIESKYVIRCEYGNTYVVVDSNNDFDRAHDEMMKIFSEDTIS